MLAQVKALKKGRGGTGFPEKHRLHFTKPEKLFSVPQPQKPLF